MGEFFRGWKRKAGIATLAASTFFAIAWIRSFEIHDRAIATSSGPEIWFGSSLGRVVLRLWSFNYASAMIQDDWSLPEWYCESIPEDVKADQSPMPLLWDFEYQRLGRGELGEVIDDEVEINYRLELPYHVIVIPLVSLSAWLLMNYQGGSRLIGDASQMSTPQPVATMRSPSRLNAAD